MSYDEGLTARVRSALEDEGVEFGERAMFGTRVFMVEGHMCVGVLDDELFVRVGPEAYAAVVTREHVRTMDFNGRESDQMVYVAADGIATDDRLTGWIACGLAYVRTLPAR